jgi:acyl-CoA reductase-like NAD-dependent aldehyde dehydrogenase
VASCHSCPNSSRGRLTRTECLDRKSSPPNPQPAPSSGARHIGDADAEVAHARRSWAEWAARPLTYRIEALRRFANVVRQKSDAFTDLLARETGKPIWEARTEVETVIAKVDISIAAYSERTGQRRVDAPMNTRLAAPPQAAWRARGARPL